MSNYQELKKLDEDTLRKIREGPGPSDECICNLLGGDPERKSLGASLMSALGISKKSKTKKNRQDSANRRIPLDTKTLIIPLDTKTGWKGKGAPAHVSRTGKTKGFVPLVTGAKGKGAKGFVPLNMVAEGKSKATRGVVPVNTNTGWIGKGLQSTKEIIKRTSSCGKCGCDDNPTVLRHSYANIRITSPDVSSICPCSSDCLPDKAKFKNNIEVIIERAHVTANQESVFETQSAPDLSHSDSDFETSDTQ